MAQLIFRWFNRFETTITHFRYSNESQLRGKELLTYLMLKKMNDTLFATLNQKLDFTTVLL